MSRNRILVIDLDPVIRSGICNFLVAHGHTVAEAPTTGDAQLQIHKFRPDVAILDFSLPNGDALELLQRIKSMESNVPVIALVGQGSGEAAIRAIQDGAEQLLIKPVELSLLHAMLLRVLANQRYRHKSLASISRIKPECVDPFLGTSAAIRRLEELARRVVSSESPILLQGETGSGKGVLANWIHCNGPRADEPFLDLNCAGLSRELLESELFGHEKGAFTSALSAKQGLLEVANRGTVFLDEVGDIDLQIQPKLLKVLENRMFRRLGDVRDRTVDIRLISATHRELLDLVRQQKFRSDLYFRVNIVPLRVPPLRERVEDIPMLAKHFLDRLAQDCARGEMTVEKSAMDALQQYSWPGNIRELRNVLERAVLLTERNHLTVHQLQLQGSSLAAQPQVTSAGTLKQMEYAYINFVLQDEGGSIERTARRLGIARSSLYNKLKRFKIPTRSARA
ncbi:MAG TPA: sigma-54 dependent transcriptional regulator [Terriglobales bacterium]|nr:sigma-54 dependent transcriptional regulator [Terriglobales bacterium]